MIESALEATMAMQLRATGIDMLREYKFHPVRKWRFDFAIPDIRLALEVEGGTWNGGRHTTGAGFMGDCVKYSEAAILGWRVIRVTGSMIKSGEAIDYVIRAIG